MDSGVGRRRRGGGATLLVHDRPAPGGQPGLDDAEAQAVVADGRPAGMPHLAAAGIPDASAADAYGPLIVELL